MGKELQADREGKARRKISRERAEYANVWKESQRERDSERYIVREKECDTDRERGKEIDR